MKRAFSFKDNKAILYLVATPIGNTSELSERAIKILQEVDYIAAEDTRVTAKLLLIKGIQNNDGSKKVIISCHEHNETNKAKEIVELIKSGHSVAYVSDAGTPCISDPGKILVEECIKNNIIVSPISGPNAGIDALIASGLVSTHFYFHGFLDAKEKIRKDELRGLYKKRETLIFYEAPHRIDKTLKNLYEIFGSRKACIARELTKIHEEFIRGNLEEFLTLDKDSLKGEMVIIVEGNKEEITDHLDSKDIINLVKNLTVMGLSTKDAIKKASDLLSLPKNKVYSLYHNSN